MYHVQKQERGGLAGEGGRFAKTGEGKRNLKKSEIRG